MIFNINRENVKEMLRNKGHFTGMQSSLTLSEQRRYLELEDIYISYERRPCNLELELCGVQIRTEPGWTLLGESGTVCSGL
jgi:hypothetical protein